MLCKKIAVCALWDEKSADYIKTLQKKLGRKYPSAHLSIGIYEDIDSDLILEYTKEFCKSQRKINMEYTGIGIMPDTIPFLYAIPKITDEILKMHHDFHQKYDDKCPGFTSLYPNRWTPHTSLCDFSHEAVDICIDYFHDIKVQLTAIKVVNVLENKYDIIGQFDLMD